MPNFRINCGRWLPSAILSCVAMVCTAGSGEVISVHYAEGEVHGFLALRNLQGKTLATGDQIQTVHNGLVNSRLVFHFRDGSLYDQTATFTQTKEFRLVRSRLIQKGPAFKDPLDLSLVCATGKVTVRYTDHGQLRTISETMQLPEDLANGLVPILLKNRVADASPFTLPMVVATPKPRLIKLAVSSVGDDRFSLGGVSRSARHFVLKVDLGGLTGIIAPLVGKQPPDMDVWILGGEAPAFLKLEGPLAEGVAPWRIELLSPVFAQTEK